MSDRPFGDHITDVVPELALGIADDRDRARAEEHLAGCADCARDLAELSRVADELLLLAPEREPPQGFRERTVVRLTGEARRAPARILEKRHPRPRWRRAASLVAAAVLGAGLTMGGIFLATGEERALLAEYRRALAQSGGSYFGGLPLRDQGGERLGTVFGYEGTPPWIFIILRSPGAAETYRVEAITVEGELIPLGSVQMTQGRASFGAALPVKLFDVARVRLVDEEGVTQFLAVAPPPAA